MDEKNVHIDTQTKATFTRMYNSLSHPVPYMKASAVVAPRTIPKEKPDIEEAIDESDEGEAAALDEAEVNEGEDEELDLKKDKLVKVPKRKAAPAKSRARKVKKAVSGGGDGGNDDYDDDGDEDDEEIKPKKRARNMFKSASRSIVRASSLSNSSRSVAVALQLQSLPVRRFINTTTKTKPVEKSSTWKATFAKWTAAGALVYWYNTSDVFAEEPSFSIADRLGVSKTPSSPGQPTIESILSERRHKSFPESEPVHPTTISQDPSKSPDAQSQLQPEENPDLMTPGELQDEATSQGAFNEETGEINWDCPCLGGMAQGPCGEEFKAAFSCFVYSKEEPKGMDCIEKFKGMQDCFRQHPEIYGSELEGEELESELTKSDVKDQVQNASATEAPETMSPAPAEPPVAPEATVKESPIERAAAVTGEVKR
ncbi:Oxidoreductase [Ascosphaera aggregata]|nr:Oxidoreductase [Ascosphaera aggregata]